MQRCVHEDRYGDVFMNRVIYVCPLCLQRRIDLPDGWDNAQA